MPVITVSGNGVITIANSGFLTVSEPNSSSSIDDVKMTLVVIISLGWPHLYFERFELFETFGNFRLGGFSDSNLVSYPEIYSSTDFDLIFYVFDYDSNNELLQTRYGISHERWNIYYDSRWDDEESGFQNIFGTDTIDLIDDVVYHDLGGHWKLNININTIGRTKTVDVYNFETNLTENMTTDDFKKILQKDFEFPNMETNDLDKILMHNNMYIGFSPKSILNASFDSSTNTYSFANTPPKLQTSSLDYIYQIGEPLRQFNEDYSNFNIFNQISGGHTVFKEGIQNLSDIPDRIYLSTPSITSYNYQSVNDLLIEESTLYHTRTIVDVVIAGSSNPYIASQGIVDNSVINDSGETISLKYITKQKFIELIATFESLYRLVTANNLYLDGSGNLIEEATSENYTAASTKLQSLI